MGRLRNIYRLGVKEFWSLGRDPMMLLLIGSVFTFGIYIAATAMPGTLNRAQLAIVDEDVSPLSSRLAAAFYPPHFSVPALVGRDEVDAGLDAGRFTFALDIPPDFQRDVLAGRAPALQLSVDATRMLQSFAGNAAIQQVVQGEVNEFVQRHRATPVPAVDLALRVRLSRCSPSCWRVPRCCGSASTGRSSICSSCR